MVKRVKLTLKMKKGVRAKRPAAMQKGTASACGAKPLKHRVFISRRELIDLLEKEGRQDRELIALKSTMDLISKLAADVDKNDLESLLRFGAQFCTFVHLYLGEENFWSADSFLDARRIDKGELTANFNDTVGDALSITDFPNGRGDIPRLYELDTTGTWEALLSDIDYYESHGGIPESRVRAFLHRSQQCFAHSMSYDWE